MQGLWVHHLKVNWLIFRKISQLAKIMRFYCILDTLPNATELAFTLTHPAMQRGIRVDFKKEAVLKNCNNQSDEMSKQKN